MDPVLDFLAALFSKAGYYAGVIAMMILVINVITSAFSGRGIRID